MAGSDQSHLYTGKTSTDPSSTQAAKDRAIARNDRLRKKREESRQLEPEVTIIAIEFKKEIDKLMYGPYSIGERKEEELTDDEFRIERRARRLVIAKLLGIQNRLNNKMRVTNRAQAKAESPDEEMDLSTDDFDE